MQVTSEAGAVASLAERNKHEVIALPTHCYGDIRCLWPRCLGRLYDLARKIKAPSNEPNSKPYLFQQISQCCGGCAGYVVIIKYFVVLHYSSVEMWTFLLQ